MSDIRQWLDEIGLTQYADAFEENEIGMALISSLDHDVLKDIGVSIAGHRLKILNVAKQFSGGDVGSVTATRQSREAPSSPLSAERRQLTVMFCDLVGSTALSQRFDPEDLRELMRHYQDAVSGAVTRYGGFVAKFLGDGVLAYFGWPQAYEDQEERAIRAGMEAVQAVRELKTDAGEPLASRVGIASGEVVVGDLVSGNTVEANAVSGETPNLAARLQGLASPDEIVIAQGTHDLIRGAFQCVDLGAHALKGIDGPVHAWRVEGTSAAVGRFEAHTVGGLTPFVGRQAEIAMLLERWAQAKDGEGQVVLLDGESGIGKSRIAQVLRKHLADEPHVRLRYHCSPYYANSAFYPIITQMEHAAGYTREDTPEVKLGKLETLLAQGTDDVPGTAPLIAAMLSLPLDRYPPLNLSPQRQKNDTITALATQVTRLARHQPLLMTFEDAHWCDPTTLEVLTKVIDQIEAESVLLVITFRPEFHPPWTGQGHVVSQSLSRLGKRQGVEIVSNLTGQKKLPPDLLERILAMTDGVPLFVEELTRSVLELGVLFEAEDRYEYNGAAHELVIPATLRELFMERLDRYRSAKEIAQIGSAIGRAFSYELVAALALISPKRLAGALAELVESGLATRREVGGETTYVFRHALLQETAYESMLKRHRQELHAKIAQAVETRFPEMAASNPEELARHLTMAGLTDAALPHWRDAGLNALRRMALAEAISHLETGLGLVAELPASVERDRREIAFRRALGAAWMAAKGWPAPEVRDSLLPALKLTDSAESPRDLLAVYWGTWSNTLSQGRVAESVEWAQTLLEMGHRSGNDEITITAELMLCVARFWLGEVQASRGHADAVMRTYDPAMHGRLVLEINHDPKTGAGIYRAQTTWMLGYPDLAVEESARNIDHARAQGHYFDLGFALAAGADLFEYRGETEIQRERVEECRRLGQEHSLAVLSDVLAPLRHGASLIRAGVYEEGIALLRSALEVREAAGGFGGSNPYFQTLLAEGLAATGDLDKAQSVIARQVEQIERPQWGERCHFAEVLRIEGWIYELRGDSDAAEASYRSSLSWAASQQTKSWELRSTTSLAVHLAGRDRASEGRELLSPILEWFTEGFTTRDLVRAREVLDSL